MAEKIQEINYFPDKFQQELAPGTDCPKEINNVPM
jgi:hypothetical protein